MSGKIPVIFGKSVQGASHKLTDTPCQDSCSCDGEVVLPDGTVILAAADGHGNKMCIYSDDGSKIAVRVFCDVLIKIHSEYVGDVDGLRTMLSREGETKVAQTVDLAWKKSVLEKHRKLKREKPAAAGKAARNAEIYKQYGTTLLGLMITETFIFAYRLGDGDIVYVDSEGAKPIAAGDKELGTDTYSLCVDASWKNAVTKTYGTENAMNIPCMFTLSTDGFANSYKDDDIFLETCADYYKMIRKHGTEAIKENLEMWLTEISRDGCGDDVTLLIAYYGT